MRKVLLGGCATAGALLALIAAPTASARDVTITSFDGTKIAAHFFPGDGVSAEKPAPTVLEGPGWSQPGDTDSGGGGASSAGGIFGVPGISNFIRRGYNVLTWDPRGFGQSGGTVQIDDPRYEARDVSALIDYVAKQPEALLDASCSSTKQKKKKRRKHRAKGGRRPTTTTCEVNGRDPRIGMAGASYGGGIQLVTAAIDKRVDAIAPTIAWNSLVTSLFPEGNIKFGWGSLLVALGVQGTLPGGASSPATAAGRQDPRFYSILTNGAATGTTSQEDLDWMASHGPGGLVEQIKVPTLLIQGTVDTLFPLDEAVTNYNAIGDNLARQQTVATAVRRKGKRHRGRKRKKRRVAVVGNQPVPVKMIWFCGGHGVCMTGAGPGASYLDQRTIAWFDRYLRGKSDVDTGPNFAWIADDAQLRTSDAYPLNSAGQLTGSASNQALPIAPGQGSGALIFATQAPVAVNVPIPGPPSDANVMGAPRLDLTYQGTASPAKTWVYAQFVNPRNGTVLDNMATPIPLTLDGQQRSLSRDLDLVAGRAPAGGGYTLQLTPSSSLYDIQRSTGAVNFSSVKVSLPLGTPVTNGSSTAPKPKKKKKKHRKRR